MFAIPIFTGSFDFNKWMKMKGWRGTIYEDNSLVIDGIDADSRFRENNVGTVVDASGNDIHTKMVPSVGRIKQMKRGIQEKVIKVYGKNRIS